MTGEGGVRRRLPAEVGCDSDFGFRSVNYCLVQLGQPVRKDKAWDSWRVGRCLRDVRTKSHVRLVDFKFSFGLGISTYWASALLMFFSAALFKSVLRCREWERLATSWLNGVCSSSFVEP